MGYRDSKVFRRSNQQRKRQDLDRNQDLCALFTRILLQAQWVLRSRPHDCPHPYLVIGKKTRY